ncbi:MAG TPA: DNA primase [Bacilli bacterium]|nr:DNA primase [Bacilli bacterium]
MNKVNYEKIIEIQKKANIVDIISDYLPLEQKGKNYFAVCPFHDDHNPSMSISQDKQIFNCFVCHSGGNVFNFIMKYEKISFLEAVKTVAKKVNIPFELNSKTSFKKEDSNKKYYDIYKLANIYYQNNLNTKLAEGAIKYLDNRNINNDIVKHFQIGVAFDDNSLSKLLLSKNYNKEELTSIGILGNKNDFIYDMFKNRIIFPLWDLEGNTVGFSGRVYNNSDESKYINSQESVIFKKGELLYNYHNALEYSKKEKGVIVVEGFMDVVGLYIAGINNVVATMGTAITRDQAILIKKLSPNVILCFDGDKAGEEATILAIKELDNIGIKPKIIRLPDNLDPDDYLKKFGVKEFKKHLDNALNIMDFRLLVEKKKINFNDSNEVSKYIRNIVKEIVKNNDEVVRDLTIKKLADETKVEVDIIKKLVRENEIVEVKPVIIRPKINKTITAEEALLYYMLKSEEVIQIYEKEVSYLSNSNLLLLANKILDFYFENKKFDINNFLIYLEDNQDLIDLLIKIDSYDLPSEFNKGQIYDYIKSIDMSILKEEINTLKSKIKVENDETKKLKLLEKLVKLKSRELE